MAERYKVVCESCGWKDELTDEPVFYKGHDQQSGCEVTTDRMYSDSEGFGVIYGHHDDSRDRSAERRGHGEFLLKKEDGTTVPLVVGNYRVARRLTKEEIITQNKETAQKSGFRI